MTDELKPCPFCGGEAELQDDLWREDKVFYRAVCGDMECQGHYCNYWSMTPEEAARRWNTRHERTCCMVYREGAPACSECGRELAYDSRYCDQCGARVVTR